MGSELSMAARVEITAKYAKEYSRASRKINGRLPGEVTLSWSRSIENLDGPGEPDPSRVLIYRGQVNRNRPLDELTSVVNTAVCVDVGSTIHFETFYRSEYRGLVALAYVLSGGRTAAEDIAQDAMLAAYRRWAEVSAYASPRGWTRRVAANLAVSHRRRRMTEAKALVRLGSQRQPLAELPAPDEEFWSAVRRLPRRQAQAIAVFYLYDCTVAEVAEVLGCAEGTVKAQLHRARQRLRTSLALPEET